MQRTFPRLIALLALIVTGALSISAVRADDWNTSRATRAEVRFLEGMSDHHQMAVDMANDCLTKNVADDLKTLCQGVIDAQTPEIQQMHDWLLAWYNVDYTTMPMSAMSAPLIPEIGEMSDVAADVTPAMGGMDMGAMATPDTGEMTMPALSGEAMTDPAGMMGMFAGFSRLDGKAYEIAWLESMIDHHDDALHMSQRVLKVAQHPDLIALANAIIKNQTAEIETMEAMLNARGDQ